MYLSHLGLVPVHAMADECRRALVAMEMSITGDYLSPTINGEFYINKPPLYSWVIVGSYKLFNEYSPFSLRFPVVLSILIHGLFIYFIVRRYTDTVVACMTALAFMTNGRTLIFDSMLGLLEHSLALVIYCGFMVIYILGEKKKYLLLFTISYFMAALGFLMKGLPAVAHHGIALLVYFIFTRNFKILFSKYHLAGIFIFMLTLAIYYIPYFIHNQISPETIFSKVFHESSKRYYFKGVGDFLHIFLEYPLDIAYHFLPWTLLLVLLIRKNALFIIRENKFVFYNTLLFLFNVPVYWFAALKNPHYLYFILPSLYTLLIYIYYRSDRADWRVKFVDMVLWIAIGLGALAIGYLPFNKIVSGTPLLWVKAIFLLSSFLLLFILYYRFKSARLFLFVLAVILFRLIFNWFVLPQRISSQQLYADRALQVHQIVQKSPLYIMANYPAGYYDGVTYYMEKYRRDILRLNHKIEDNAYYLVDDANVKQYPNEVLYQFPFNYMDNNLRYEGNMYLVKFKPQ